MKLFFDEDMGRGVPEALHGVGFRTSADARAVGYRPAMNGLRGTDARKESPWTAMS